MLKLNFFFPSLEKKQEKLLAETGPVFDKLCIIISHFTDEATEAPRNQVTCQKYHKQMSTTEQKCRFYAS